MTPPMLSIVLPIAVLLSGVALAAGPAVVSTSWQFKNIVVDSMEIRAFIVKVKFDQPIYINGLPITHANQTYIAPQHDQGGCNGGGGGGGGPTWPALTVSMAGTTNISCTNFLFQSRFTQSDFPNYLMATFLTRDVGSTFLGAIGSFMMPEYVDPNGIAFIKLMSAKQGGQVQMSEATDSDILTCGNKVITIVPSAIKNAQGQPITSSTITITSSPTMATCDYDGISAFKDAFTYVADMAKKLVLDASLFDQFKFLQGSLESRDVLDACKQLVAPMFSTKVLTKTLLPTQQCLFPQGSREFAASPCCNRTLQYTQCCAPVSVVANLTVIKDIQTSVIQSTCSNPDKILLSLYSYINSLNPSLTLFDTQDELSNRWQKFTTTCSNLIYSQKCAVDADCLYSKSCDSNMGSCKVPWGLDADLTLQCYYDQFDPQHRTALAGSWGISDDSKTAFVAKMGSLLLKDDCVGNNAFNLQSRCQGDNNGCTTCTESNRTLCLAEKSCNWNNQIQSQQECLATNPVDSYTSFCGQCWNGGASCWSQTSPDMCVADFYRTKADCDGANLNLTWYTPAWQQGQCVDASKKNASSCLPSTICSQVTSDGRGCDSGNTHICYAPNVNQTVCNSASSVTRTHDGQQYNLQWQSWLNNQTGLCAVSKQWQSQLPFTPSFCSSFSSAVGNKPVLFYPGRTWTEGQLNTPEKCAIGRCNWNDPQGRESGWNFGKAQCESRSMCSQSCPRCRTWQWGGPGFCYATATNITMNICFEKQGNWMDNVVGQTGRCFFMQDSATGSQSACVAAGAKQGLQTKFASCEGESIDTCAAPSTASVGELGAFLKCQWDMNAPCRTPQECAQAGRCSDDDKSVWTNDGVSRAGACRVDNHPDQYGWPADCGSQKSKTLPRSNTTLTWSRFPLKCIDPVPANASACAAIGGQWVTRAKTKEECLADKACFSEGSNWANGMSSTQCSRCSGTTSSLYDWSPGKWINGSMIPFQWAPKQYSSVNAWAKRVDNMKQWDALINPAINFYLGSAQYGQLTSKYSLVADLYKQISCACSPGHETRQCFGSIEASPVGSTYLQKGKLNKLETPLGVVKAMVASDNKTHANRRRLLADGSVSITVSQVTAQSLAVVVNNQPNYEVVLAAPSTSKVVGELAGDGSDISGFSPSITSASVTLNFAQTITVNKTTYPVGWIGKLVVNKVVAMKGISVVVGNGSVTTTNITTDGTYFPIFLQQNWKTFAVTTKAPTSTATVYNLQSSGAPTTATTAGPTTAAPHTAATTAPTSSATPFTSSSMIITSVLTTFLVVFLL